MTAARLGTSSSQDHLPTPRISLFPRHAEQPHLEQSRWEIKDAMNRLRPPHRQMQEVVCHREEQRGQGQFQEQRRCDRDEGVGAS